LADNELEAITKRLQRLRMKLSQQFQPVVETLHKEHAPEPNKAGTRMAAKKEPAAPLAAPEELPVNLL
jgi:hypothetical protein